MNTKDLLLKTASKIAAKQGVQSITRERVAEKADMSVGSVSYHFGSMDSFRSQVFDRAVLNQDLDTLASFIAVPKFRKRLEKGLRERVVAHLAGE